jgi:hypothetical protein
MYIYTGDFGESRCFIPSETAGTLTALGTMLYMSPEMVKNDRYCLFRFGCKIGIHFNYLFYFQTFIPIRYMVSWSYSLPGFSFFYYYLSFYYRNYYYLIILADPVRRPI